VMRAQQPDAIPVVPPDARLAAPFRRRPSGIGVERRIRIWVQKFRK